jgi:phosphoribosyl-ATP pyrophosphohydrolase
MTQHSKFAARVHGSFAAGSPVSRQASDSRAQCGFAEAGPTEAYESMFTLDDLARIVAERASAGADQSYTSALLGKGVAHCAKKFGEEAVELAIAAVAQDDKAVRAEAADVLYHLLVVLQSRNVALADVMNELERRTRQSGLAEKASRRV